MHDAAMERARSGRAGWTILVALGGLLLLNGVGLYVFIESTGEGRTVALLVTAFGALALDVALAGLGGHRRAWRTGWIVAGALGALTLHMLLGGATEIAAWYGMLTALAVTGLLLARTD